MFNSGITLGKWKKRTIIFFIDICMTIIALRGASWLTAKMHALDTRSTVIMTIIQCISFGLCGLYRGVWRFASIPDLIRIIRAVLLGTIASIIFFQIKFRKII